MSHHVELAALCRSCERRGDYVVCTHHHYLLFGVLWSLGLMPIDLGSLNDSAPLAWFLERENANASVAFDVRRVIFRHC
jgi:hypothetical protein